MEINVIYNEIFTELQLNNVKNKSNNTASVNISQKKKSSSNENMIF